MKILRFDNIIFDLDGTLLNTLEDIRDSLNHSLRHFGLPVKSMAEVRQSVGNGSARLVELSVPGGLDDPRYPAVLAFYSEWYEAHSLIKTRPYDGVIPLMERLRAMGARLAIVSNKPDAAVRALNDGFFAGLVEIAVGEREGIRRKPAPDSALEAMRALGGAKSGTAYVGDSEVDVMTARNAGLPCISVAWGFRTTEQLAEAGANEIVSTAAELFKALT